MNIDPLFIMTVLVTALVFLASLLTAVVATWLGRNLFRRRSPVDDFLADAPGDVPHISDFDRASMATRFTRAFLS